MAQKTDTDVVIGGKVFTLSGFESEEYLQKVASYLNNKNNECEKSESFRHLSRDLQQVMLQINVVDDYFRAKKEISLLEDELKAKDDELSELKHKLIGAQMKLDESLKRLKGIDTAGKQAH